ncbi:uncharacterized protein LOC119644575 [Glossina fuscipes]|uniref:Uncharacterized protein LOC119644575 n=2 Tax=Nemorhina TaxID=44051 RepID=A0A9C5ZN91_9MUSC|nr:uncharacterized protein LOC119644575 [Glossina fuscipes]KAI9589929.1 hypothetical protein GQX74_008097 [Glossina fuscipes]
MKGFLILNCLLSLIVLSNTYSFYIPAKIGRPGVCMYHGMMLQRGDNNMLSSCQNLHCNDDGSILVQGCGHHHMRDCRIIDPTNLHRPYPECCKMNFLCTADNGQYLVRELSPLDRPTIDPQTERLNHNLNQMDYYN